MESNIRKKWSTRIFLCVIMSFIFIISSSISVLAVQKKEVIVKTVEDVQYNKVWTITMNAEININTIKNNVFVEDAYGNRINSIIEIGNKKNEIIVKPPKGGYKFNDIYNLIISGDLRDINGIRLKDDIKTIFTIEDKPKIEMFKLDKNPIIEGESIGVILNSNIKGNIQYKLEAIDNKTGEQINLLDYSDKIKGNDVTFLNYKEGLKEGSYKLRAYVKRVDIDTSDYIYSGYDCVEEIQLNVVNGKLALDTSRDIQLGNSDMIKIGQKYGIGIGKNISIKGVQGLKEGEYLYKINAYNTTFKEQYINQVDYDYSINWQPPKVGEYIIEILIKNKKSNQNYDAIKTIIVDVDNKIFKYIETDLTVEEFAQSQFERNSAVYYSDGEWRKASKEMIEYYLDPENFINDEDDIYQFLTLNYVEGITANDINEILKNKGILDGKGQAILDGAKKHNINPAYLIAHTILETGHGSSSLANGIKVTTVDGQNVEPKVVYNMYGIQAIDQDANKYGSEFAYKQGWFTPEIALTEGAKWVGANYINNDEFHQNTLYEMRWNKEYIWHQYATDVKWAVNQTERIKQYLDLSTKVILEFEIPVYKNSNISKEDNGIGSKEEIIIDETPNNANKNNDNQKKYDVIDLE